MNNQMNIEQIIPAFDWYAVLRDEYSQENKEHPVAFWALVNDDGKQSVVGISMGKEIEGQVFDELPEFEEYVYKPALRYVGLEQGLDSVVSSMVSV